MAADRASIQAFLDQAGEVWKTNDGGAFADLFTEDGSLINPFGERVDGRGAVGAMYSEFFKGMLSGTSTTMTVQSVRAVGDGYAFADCDQTITGAEGQAVLAGHLAALLRHDNGSWYFLDARPYTFPEIPQ